jgi:hypothetical protein
MTWESIAILLIMLSYFVYAIRSVTLIRNIQTGHEPDDVKDEKTARLKRNVRTWFIFVIVVILILFLSDLINRNI